MPELRLADGSERDDLGAFVARAVRLDQQCAIRLRTRSGEPGAEVLDAWMATPFDTLVTRSVRGAVHPNDLTVHGSELLASLAVSRGDGVDPGAPQDLLWRSALPPADGWVRVDDLPAGVVSDLADRGVAVARENAGPKGNPPASLLDQAVLTVSGSGFEVKVPMRCLFSLSGMGFVGGADSDDLIRVSATDSWLRMDARFGAVVRRRHALLPLLF
ncbi:hypothetical protein C1701_18235 [Actinoalloteichus sp. AHMU CJ021]|uniref:Uncharacterized protein n=1 Tax=Actinoalloteichus caeruleus DSM 43889 TaxID=1120930 RepID=A0ABT1JNM7_ACTCY|nr:hypothetical protein [Actinoalloteichus caeruleus]AUS79951.1 hypothetical protein C1701_18235 [Actinoalloteichus sp. AHMU CJ021]MCP2334132.1 hypothetical protein [Actinoalloteichus caeruleus DSM 43889]